MALNRLYPYILVFFQLGSLIYIAITASVISDTIPGFLVECTGVFLAVHAIYVVKIKNVNITPTVKNNSELVTSGPYSIIRHPMYIAQIIAVIPLVIDYFTVFRLVAFLILVITLIIKISYEEKQLNKHFPAYREYSEKTWKLIPYIF